MISAGGVIVVRRTEAGARIAVMESGGLASLPRAEVGPGESAETAARRAARVFIGGSTRLRRTLGETRESTDEGLVLTWFWLASVGRWADPEPASPCAPPPGFRVHWMEVEEARLSLESEDEADLLAHLGSEELRAHPSPLASAERRELRAALSLTRERTLGRHGASDALENMDAAGTSLPPGEAPDEGVEVSLETARFELHRAEQRLARGDLEGARRAQARAARAGLFSLDSSGRRVEFARLWGSLPDSTRQGLGLGGFTPGLAPGLEQLLTLHDAAESEREEGHRRQAAARGHQVRASLALLGSAAAFSWLAAAAPLAVEHGFDIPVMYALHACLLGAVGGWTGGALRRIRSVAGLAITGRPVADHEVSSRRDAAQGIAPAPVFEVALGAAAGLAAGLALSGGLTAPLSGGHLAFAAVGTYAAGWFGVRQFERR